MMKASIIIPAYNEEERIADVITSALMQNYPSFEIIVVNNHSTDRTKEIAVTFPVTVIDEQRKGLLYAREAGRKQSSGEIIANLDADCLPEKDWLFSGAAHFADEKVIAVSGPYLYHDLGLFAQKFFLLTFQYISRPMNTIMQLPFIKRGGVLVGGNTFIRASVLEKTNGYEQSDDFYGEDTNTAKRISPHGRINFDADLIMKTSGRRFNSEGFMALSRRYFIAFFTARK